MDAPTQTPYFSIIIPFYNEERFIGACLDSLAAQDFPSDNYEIICVNNNSTDSSVSIARRYPLVKLTSLDLVDGKIQNVYAVRNTGIKNARGPVIVFTDADVEVRPDWLSNIYSSIQNNNYDIVIGWYRPARPVKLLGLHCLLLSERIKSVLKDNLPSMLRAGANNLIIKKEVFENEGMFLYNSNGEDMYFVRRCMEKGYRVGFEDSISVKRNDIDSIGTLILKNFIYGCSGTLGIKSKSSFMVKSKYVLKYLFMYMKFMFGHFPVGMLVPLFTFSYLAGYALTMSRLLTPNGASRLIYKYTLSMKNKR